ncbi:XRE family transcriptional regulator [Cetobacterium somerae]|uniref:XRE family transcriptional regulator n=1 Tax=Cetobacterium somerae TaxID=188913 RepID=UPI002257E8EA|nr:XRE family transcriptional regulator [Cetobacterium somerae]
MNDYIIPEEIRTKLGEYIKNIREQNGLGLNQLAVKIDVVSSLLSRLENGKVLKVNPFLLKKISEGLKINYKELYKIVGYLEEDEEIPKVETKLVELPVYGRAAAGNGYINMENIIRTEYLVAIPGEDFPKGAFIAEVYGESMFPTLLDGDFAIVDPDCNDKNINNQICVVTYNGQTFIKRIVRKEKYVVLMSDNPDRVKYEDIIVPTDEYSDLVCHGIVIECRRKFKRR